MLVGALRHHEGALRASLAAEYPGLPPLRQILRGATGMTMPDLADYVAGLPPGCALWRATGGPLAWTHEMHLMSALLHRLDIMTWQNTGMMQQKPKGKAPEPIAPPPLKGQEDVKAAVIENKRARRQARRSNVGGAK